MMKENLHAFVVLAYKDSPYLEECVSSLKKQTVASDIYIATSTCSQFIKDIAIKYSLKLAINSDSRGIASDWSFAYNYCKNEYVTLAHQDDIYMPRYTEYCLKEAKKVNPKVKLMIFTGYKDIIGSKERKFAPHILIKSLLLFPFFIKRNISSQFVKKLVLSFGNPIPCPTVMYHKNEIGKFDFASNFVCNMDWDAWFRLAGRSGTFCYVNKQLLLHRIHDCSQTNLQIKNDVRRQEDKLMFDRLWLWPFSRFLAHAYSLSMKSNISNV